jgi:hypothetical protein
MEEEEEKARQAAQIERDRIKRMTPKEQEKYYAKQDKKEKKKF